MQQAIKPYDAAGAACGGACRPRGMPSRVVVTPLSELHLPARRVCLHDVRRVLRRRLTSGRVKAMHEGRAERCTISGAGRRNGNCRRRRRGWGAPEARATRGRAGAAAAVDATTAAGVNSTDSRCHSQRLLPLLLLSYQDLRRVHHCST